jgi:hypothetical protein
MRLLHALVCNNVSVYMHTCARGLTHGNMLRAHNLHPDTYTSLQCLLSLCPADTSYSVGGFESFTGLGPGTWRYYTGQTQGAWTFSSGGVANQANDWELEYGGSRQRVAFLQSACIGTTLSTCSSTIHTNMTQLVSVIVL